MHVSGVRDQRVYVRKCPREHKHRKIQIAQLKKYDEYKKCAPRGRKKRSAAANTAWQIICCLREYIQAAKKRACGKKCHVISANSAQCLSLFILYGVTCVKNAAQAFVRTAERMPTGRGTKRESIKIVGGHVTSHAFYIRTYGRFSNVIKNSTARTSYNLVNCEIKWIFMWMQLSFLHSQPPSNALVTVELIKCFSNSHSIIKLVTDGTDKCEIKLTTIDNIKCVSNGANAISLSHSEVWRVKFHEAAPMCHTWMTASLLDTAKWTKN